MQTAAMTDEDIQAILAQNIRSVHERMASACRRAGQSSDEVTLVAVTKYVSSRIAQMIVDLGVCNLGESRPQELWRKAETVKGDVSWHLIGHLQRNKIERTLPLVKLMHSADSFRVIAAVNSWCERQHFVADLLVEVNLSGETAKTGMSPFDVLDLEVLIAPLKGVRILGLMTMAALQESEECRPTFSALRRLRDQVQTKLDIPMPVLSMGMSNDFEVAIEEGATMVRVGSCLFEGIPDERLKT